MVTQLEITDAPEPWDGFDDAVSVWMALVTERERLKQIVEKRSICEPMFGAPQTMKQLSDEQVARVAKKLTRVTELAAMVMDRRRQLAAVFAEAQP